MKNEILSPDDTAKPALLVVFPCLNEARYLDTVVRQFVRSLREWPVRFVIVDGGSSDASPSIAQKLCAEYPEVSFLSNHYKLQSAAVNLAVKQFGADRDYLIRVDVHAGYPDNYVQCLVKEAERSGADSVVVGMIAEGSGWFQKAVAVAQNSVLGNGGSMHRLAGQGGRWVDHGHHALMRLEAFRVVGGYDETFSHNEDAELDWRLLQAGRRLWLTDLTSISYFPRSNPLSLLLQYYKYGCGRARNIIKNDIRLKLRQMLPTFVFPACLLALFFSLTPLALVPAFAWIALCLLSGLWVGRNETLSVGFAVGLAAMVMHLGWSTGFLRCMICGKRGCP